MIHSRVNRFILAALFFTSVIANASHAAGKPYHIVILGDSLSSGLGVEPEQAYPSLVQVRLKSSGRDHIKITNASISGSTTAGAVSRLKWFLRAKPDMVILALGANDGLRGLSIKEMEQNLGACIELALDKQIKTVLAGMKIPPNYGQEYTRAFETAFENLSRTYDIPLIPFLLKDVAGKSGLNQADGIHPNADGHKIIARTVLETILEQL
ncbi:MAG: arylesterase [Desulfobacteraceae bacterium]|nr:MAG: arylesterase [Desulfobacteraceae bacterium]